MSIDYVVPVSLHNDLVAAAYRARDLLRNESKRRAVFGNHGVARHPKTHQRDQRLFISKNILGSKAADAYPARKSRTPSKLQAVADGTRNKKLDKPSRLEARAER